MEIDKESNGRLEEVTVLYRLRFMNVCTPVACYLLPVFLPGSPVACCVRNSLLLFLLLLHPSLVPQPHVFASSRLASRFALPRFFSCRPQFVLRRPFRTAAPPRCWWSRTTRPSWPTSPPLSRRPTWDSPRTTMAGKGEKGKRLRGGRAATVCNSFQ